MKRHWIQAVCILLFFFATSTVASTSSVAESGSIITIPALSSTVTPVVDGTCATTEYGDANQIEVNSVRAKIYLKRTAHDLYICFGEMYVVFSPSNIINIIVYIDRNAQGEPDDDNFRIVQPVSVRFC